MSVNKLIVAGHLGGDPQERKTASGSKVVSFSVATSERWWDATTGERREITNWHRVVIFNERVGEIAMKYLKKGSQAYVEGMSLTRSYENKGEKKYVTELVIKQFNGNLVLLDRAEGQKPDENSYGGQAPIDDEVPF